MKPNNRNFCLFAEAPPFLPLNQTELFTQAASGRFRVVSYTLSNLKTSNFNVASIAILFILFYLFGYLFYFIIYFILFYFVK
jgi:hypothetical protein